MIANLQHIVQEKDTTIEELTRSKLDLINNVSSQIETLREQVVVLSRYIIMSDNNSHKKNEGTKIENKAVAASSSPLSWLSFGRSVFSGSAVAPTQEVQEITNSKINLLNHTSCEIDRLRDIIKVLGKQLRQ